MSDFSFPPYVFPISDVFRCLDLILDLSRVLRCFVLLLVVFPTLVAILRLALAINKFLLKASYISDSSATLGPSDSGLKVIMCKLFVMQA